MGKRSKHPEGPSTSQEVLYATKNRNQGILKKRYRIKGCLRAGVKKKNSLREENKVGTKGRGHKTGSKRVGYKLENGKMVRSPRH